VSFTWLSNVVQCQVHCPCTFIHQASSSTSQGALWRRKTVPVSIMATIASKHPSPTEWAFLAVFHPAVLGFYVICKYPHWILPAGADPRTFYLLGKSPGFWYASS